MSVDFHNLKGTSYYGHVSHKAKLNYQDSLDVSKPWVHASLRQAIFKRAFLREVVGNLKQEPDICALEAQKNLVSDLILEAQQSFFARQPSQETYWVGILAEEYLKRTFTCDVCQIHFRSLEHLSSHIDKHQTCQIDSCMFVATPGALEKHILHLHASGLYNRASKQICEEDMEKWKAERKRNYPSVDANIKRTVEKASKKLKWEEDRKRRQEIWAEKLALKRKVFVKKKETAKEHETAKEFETVNHRQTISKKVIYNDPESEDDENFNEDFIMFKGTTRHLQTELICQPLGEEFDDNKVKNDNSDLISDDDDEWQLMEGKFGTNVIESSLNNSNDKGLQEADDENVSSDEMPEEIPNIKPHESSPKTIETERISESPPKTIETERISQSPPKKIETERIYNSKRKRRRVRTSVKANLESLEKPKPVEMEIKFVRKPKRPPTLMEKLLSHEIEQERLHILQIVRYVCQHNFFRDPKNTEFN